MYYIILIILGLAFGSFVNALVWRVHQQSRKTAKIDEFSILKGRSMCVNCRHVLSAKDLLPLVSWLSVLGKCRYCKKPISVQYPFVEALTAALFVISYAFWPQALEGWATVAFATWLALLVGFMALVVYDIRWMLLPNKIVYSLYVLGLVYVISNCLAARDIQPLIGAIIGIAVGGGIFYLLFIVSDGKWIGGGDVKLGFLLGAIVGGPVLAFLVLFLASLLGTLVSVPLLAYKKQRRIAFGPFLIAGCIAVTLFGARIVEWYVDMLML